MGKVEIQIRSAFVKERISSLSQKEREKVVKRLAEQFASSKVPTIEKNGLNSKPLPAEVQYERERILHPGKKAFGIFYSGYRLAEIFLSLIPESESNFKHCHILFTNQLFGTWDENDGRWHARVSLYGFPSIISTTGVVEAPAKPREFYLRRQMGLDNEEWKRENAGQFIDYDDPRLTEVLKGYVMQAIFYHFAGEAFCHHNSCRLYNAHWQAEVIQSQLGGEYEFCPLHEKILRERIFFRS